MYSIAVYNSFMMIQRGPSWFYFMANFAFLRRVSVQFNMFIQTAAVLQPSTAIAALYTRLLDTHVRDHVLMKSFFCFEYFCTNIADSLIDSVVYLQYVRLQYVLRLETETKNLHSANTESYIENVAYFFWQISQINFWLPVGCTSIKCRFRIWRRENRLWHSLHWKFRFSSSKWRRLWAVNVRLSVNFFEHLVHLKKVFIKYCYLFMYHLIDNSQQKSILTEMHSNRCAKWYDQWFGYAERIFYCSTSNRLFEYYVRFDSEFWHRSTIQIDGRIHHSPFRKNHPFALPFPSHNMNQTYYRSHRLKPLFSWILFVYFVVFDDLFRLFYTHHVLPCCDFDFALIHHL